MDELEARRWKLLLQAAVVQVLADIVPGNSLASIVDPVPVTRTASLFAQRRAMSVCRPLRGNELALVVPLGR